MVTLTKQKRKHPSSWVEAPEFVPVSINYDQSVLIKNSKLSLNDRLGFNRAETNCRIAHILGILLKNSFEFQILLEATVTFIYSLPPLNSISNKMWYDIIMLPYAW